MLNSIKKMVQKDTNDKTISAKDSKLKGTFGGLSGDQIKKQIELSISGQQNSSLVQSKVGEKAKESLASYKKEKHEQIKVTSNDSLEQELATIFSEGDTATTINMLRQYLNENKGSVDKRYWYMLMNCYEVAQSKNDFEKVALSFAHLFGTSPPSWIYEDVKSKENMVSGKNIMILESILKIEHTQKYKEFLLAAKGEKFCRINLSPCKFDQSEVAALQQFYKLMTDLRKNQVLSVLMGDNNLISFCKLYIQQQNTKILKQEFLEQEELFWLIYLEILQWKGQQEEFENVALEYAMKFEISPPGYEEKGVMKIEKLTNSMAKALESSEEEIEIDKELNANNIENLLKIIEKDFESNKNSEIDLKKVDRIDFAAAGSISYKIQELWSQENHAEKKVIFKNPNELILTLLEMVGVTEFVEIIPRKY
jgi:ABC-type transporter Mla MlaB component